MSAEPVLVHRGCGGEVISDPASEPYVSEEYGVIPVQRCRDCGEEIFGDRQLEWVGDAAYMEEGEPS